MGRKKKTETTEEAIVKEEKKAKPKTKKKTEPKVATKKDRTPRKRLTEQEIKEWNDLYQYVRLKVLGYDENQSLPKFFVLRLKGLLVNKFLETYDVEDTANYSYATILNTFRYCALDIQWALKNVSFRDESHKLNYILKIVEPNINTVYLREKNMKKAQEKVERVDTSISTHKGAEYAPKKKVNDKFKDLW